MLMGRSLPSAANSHSRLWAASRPVSIFPFSSTRSPALSLLASARSRGMFTLIASDIALTSQQHRGLVTIGVAANIDTHRKLRDMGREGLDVNGQGGDYATQPLRADAGPVDRFQQLRLQRSHTRIWVRVAQISEKRLLGEQGALLQIPPDAYTHHDWRTGVCACPGNRVHDFFLHAFPAGRRGEHHHLAHVLAAGALGNHSDYQLIHLALLEVDDRGRVVAGVLSLEQWLRHEAGPQVSIGVAPAHPFGDGAGQGAPLDGNARPLPNEDHGYAGVLAVGYPLNCSHIRIAQQLLEDGFPLRRFLHFECSTEGRPGILRQLVGCRDAQLAYLIGDLARSYAWQSYDLSLIHI